MDRPEISIHFDPIHPGSAVQDIEVCPGKPALEELFPRGEGRFFVTDSNVAQRSCAAPFLRGAKNLFVLPPGEEHKTLGNVGAIVKAALDCGMNRRGVFTAAGGGVVTDMTGFAASIFMRGALWEALPTTLLAMVDAAIGGKTGCDIEGHKNTAGAFFPARRVRCFPALTSTLTEGEYRSGLAEAFKTALLFDEDLFCLFRDKKNLILSRDPGVLTDMVRVCVCAKAAVVEEDFTEQGRRAFLNLGHTFGHALESVAGLGTVTHGDAVAWGIGRALEVSAMTGLCSPSYRDGAAAVLGAYGWETGPWHPALGRSSVDDLIAAMRRDKKNRGAGIRLVLQRDFGATVVRETEEELIRRVLP
ncbi:MAG: 3-dehydroquinate synthase [Spirochaetaceae bacterium]|jgi:3-dehydroquinate synthase|nr:3-dehydroquinate synthase [Spirochaetaceae bacterium]